MRIKITSALVLRFDFWLTLLAFVDACPKKSAFAPGTETQSIDQYATSLTPRASVGVIALCIAIDRTQAPVIQSRAQSISLVSPPIT